jgi:CubicO group peptidase (beta-lactamase class C family)
MQHTRRPHPLEANSATRWALALVACLATSLAAAAPVSPQRLTPAELEAFFDGVMAEGFERHTLAGASVAVVFDGEILFAKGYGHADVAAGIPVDPFTTAFATGSVAKLFTWLAIMQLVEAGRIDLQADVNTYLAHLRVPEAYGESVRVWHLLSHTPGFEDRPVVGLFSRTAEGLPSLEAALHRSLPARIAPPGRYAAYSNYGSALAGQIVAEVSGMPWETYLERHVLGPLGMTATSARQPVPASLARHVTRVYRAQDGVVTEQPFEYVPLAPAGGMVASAGDMARFMLAHLGGGLLGDVRVLSDDAARRMHTQLFSHDPRLPGNAYGFWEGVAHGERFIGHDGDTMLSHARLALWPHHGLGLYVAYNSAEGGLARAELWDAFVEHVFPADTVTAAPSPALSGSLGAFVGSYGINRVATTTLGKLGALLGSLAIGAGDGHLQVGLAATPIPFAAVGADEFLEVGGERRVIFRQDPHGHVTHVFLSDAPMLVGVPRAWHASLALHGGVFLGGLLVLLSALVTWPVAELLARRRRATSRPGERLARGSAASAALLFVAFLATFVLALPNPMDVVYGVTPLLTLALGLGIGMAIVAAASAVFVVVAWRRAYWGRAARIHYTVVVGAGLALVWQLDYWNLLGIRV